MRHTPFQLTTARKFATAASGLALASAASATTVDIQSFQAQGYASTQAEAFCGERRIIGGVINSNGAPSGAVMTLAGKTRPMEIEGNKITRPYACQSGYMMGSAFYGPFGFSMRGFMTDRRGLTEYLMVPGGANTAVRGRNASGTVVGYYAPDGGLGRNNGFVWREGVYTPYSLPGIRAHQLMAINDEGTMVGHYTDESGERPRAIGFIDQGGRVTTLQVPGAFDTKLTGINRHGQLVGQFNTSFGGGYQGFVWQNGVFTAFAPAGALDTYVWSIDDLGRAVGYAYFDGNGQSAFVATVRP